MDSLIKIAADDISTLRRSDVFRVLAEAGYSQRSRLAAYITEHRPDLADEVVMSMEELS